MDRGYATAITPGALQRGRLYHVQYKPLCEAIGEANNRHRTPASLGRFVERLMLLDAVLADPRCGLHDSQGSALNAVQFLSNTVSVRVCFKNGVFEPIVRGRGMRRGQICTVFLDEELRVIRETIGWLTAVEKSFEFWNDDIDC